MEGGCGTIPEIPLSGLFLLFLFVLILHHSAIHECQHGYETLGSGSFIMPHSCTQEGHSEFVGSEDRDEMVQWLCLLTDDLHYRLEVFFRATSLLDSFLSLMKVRLSCSWLSQSYTETCALIII